MIRKSSPALDAALQDGNSVTSHAPFEGTKPLGNTGNSYHVTSECYLSPEKGQETAPLSQKHDGNSRDNSQITPLPQEITLPHESGEKSAAPKSARQAALSKDEVFAVCQTIVNNNEVLTVRKVHNLLKRGSLRTVHAMVSEFSALQQKHRDKDILDMRMLSPKLEDQARKLLAEATRQVREGCEKAISDMKAEYDERLKRLDRELIDALNDLQEMSDKNECLTKARDDAFNDLQLIRRENNALKNELNILKAELGRKQTRDSYLEAIGRLVELLIKAPDKIKNLEDLLKPKDS